MPRRLNMWQRLGIVLSGLWVLGGGTWGVVLAEHDVSDWPRRNLEACDRIEATTQHPANQPDDFTACEAQYSRAVDEGRQGFWFGVTIFVFAPLVLAWLLAWASVKIGRWVWAGRRPVA